MKISLINCPCCGGRVNGDTKITYCPYCGSQLKLGEDITITKNVSIKKEYTDTAAILKIKSEQKEFSRSIIKAIIITLLCIAIIASLILIPYGIKRKEDLKALQQQQLEQQRINDAIAQGKIAIGCSDESCVDKKYSEVLYQLQAAGFTNIVLNDLGTGGFLWLKIDNVKSISVAGKTDFSSDDYFFPDVQIVITYY